MESNTKRIRIFVSCPGDIKDEIDSIKLIVDKINKTFGNQNSYFIEILNWNTDTYTQIGDDGQDVINKQIDNKYDILVGLMWMRIGTPTKRDKSGTIEEINRAINNSNKEQLIYFKTKTPDDLNSINLDEYSKVKDFKEDLKRDGVLFKEFNSIEGFDNLFEIQLPNLIFDKFLKIDSEEKSTSKPILNNDSNDDYAIGEQKYARIVNLIDKVKNVDKVALDLDIFNATEESSSYLKTVTNHLNSMTTSMSEWTDNMNRKSIEMQRINAIKDDRLRISKQKMVINLFAKETEDFNIKIKNELPSFSKNFRKVGPSYASVILIANKFKSSETKNLLESAHSLRNGVESSLENLASLLEALMEFPPMNMRFNKVKRETELTLNRLMSETLEGLKLLDEALNL